MQEAAAGSTHGNAPSECIDPRWQGISEPLQNLIRVGSEGQQNMTGLDILGPIPPGSRCKTDTISIGGLGGNSIRAASGPANLDHPKAHHSLRWSVDVDPYDAMELAANLKRPLQP